MLLAVDTSTRMMGLSLYDGFQVLGEMTWHSHNFHTVELAPAVDNLLKRCSTEPTDLKALGVALGPGSFTGLRIGLAIIKGMSQGLNIHVIGIPTLDFLAAAQPLRDIPMVAILQAGRGRLAFRGYLAQDGNWISNEEITVLTVDELADTIEQPTLVCGELTAEERQIITAKNKNVFLASPAHSIRRPSFLAELAWQHWKNGNIADVVSLSPIYLPTREAIEE
ncbi:MAG: tRNA (adenosine(37)-N6)-threonylcarbamoyltransferase complex dimerization subunit type 1 TsaB [Anaerolineaceae bacterium]|nr:tRNA (adenosine(37)-N6)-threonylcarbamoyltransferase complex dimerization subunit type 1 TsaB [Anaerolineaceae bacterium]